MRRRPLANPSFNRSKDGGFCNPAKLPKGPNGRALCRQCSTEVPTNRRTFCSEPCIHEWKIRTSPGYARDAVFKRDHGVCASCRLDTVAVVRELGELKQQAYRAEYGVDDWAWDRGKYTAWPYRLDIVWPVAAKAFFVRCQEIGLRGPWKGETLWHADHIVPVVEGGGECGLENLRSLCVACHRRETAALRKRLAKKRAMPPT